MTIIMGLYLFSVVLRMV